MASAPSRILTWTSPELGRGGKESRRPHSLVISPKAITFELPPMAPRLQGRTSSPDLQAKHDQAYKRTHALETLHSFDMGVSVTLQSMVQHWQRMATGRHVSVAESRIFRREADRLAHLLAEAERDVARSRAVFDKAKRRTEQLARALQFADGSSVKEGGLGGKPVKRAWGAMEDAVSANAVYEIDGTEVTAARAQPDTALQEMRASLQQESAVVQSLQEALKTIANEAAANARRDLQGRGMVPG